MNEVMIARYFKNKAGLLEAILVELIESAQLQSNERPLADSLDDELRLLIGEKCRAYLKKIDLHKISLARLMIDPKLSAQVHKHVYPVAEAIIAKRLEGFKRRGQINVAYDITVLAKLVQMACVGILTMMCVKKQIDEEAIFQMVDNFAPILAHGFQLAPRQK